MNETLNSKKPLQENNEETVNNQHIHKTHLSFYNLTSSTQSHCRNSEHMFSCINGAPEAYKCKICNFTSALKVNLIDHAVQVHNIPKMKHNLALIMKKLECQNCNLQTYSFLIFKLHRCNSYQLTRNTSIENKAIERNTNSGIQLLKCELCAYTTKDEYFLKIHTFCKHRPSLMGSQVDNKTNLFACNSILNLYKCRICDFATHLYVLLQNHILKAHKGPLLFNYEIESFTCNVCNLQTFSILTLYNHVCTHGNSLKEHTWYYCTLCSYKSNRMYSLKEHFGRKHPSEAMFKCDHCRFICVDSRNFERHLERHRRSARVQVNKLKSSLTVHVKSIYSDKRNLNREEHKWYYCTLCSRKSTRAYSLKVHFRLKHPSGTLFKCDHCKFKCVDNEHFKRHLKWHSARVRENKANWLYCEFCKYKSAYLGNLKKHLLSKHKDVHKINWFRCEHCDFNSKLKSNLRFHVKCIHSDKKNLNHEEHKCYYCTLCSRKSIHAKSLKEHFRRKHPSGTMFKCDHCRFKCVDSTHFERHLTRHTATVRENKVKWLYCEFCKYKSPYLGNLKTHLLLKHEDDHYINWFRCEHCDFKSKLKSTFTVHLKSIHSGKINVKWFNCEHCEFKSVNRTRFKCHLLEQHGQRFHNRWINCEYCNYKCKYPCRMKEHLNRKHTDKEIRWFNCELCERKFKMKHHLKSHVWTQHI